MEKKMGKTMTNLQKEIDQQETLLKRCYEVICKLPEIENAELLYELNQLELELYRYFK